MTHRSDVCLNCSADAPDVYCGRCGQKNADYRESFRELLSEIVDELFQVDSRILRTIGPFVLRPGFLTREWCAGRRMRYSSPLRIYLLASVVFFFGLSLGPHRGVTFHASGESLGISVGEERPATTHESMGHIGIAPIDRKLEALNKLPPAEASLRIFDELVSQLPKALFALVPIFALLVKLLHRRSGRYYVEHLIFGLHLHSFVFFLFLVMLPAPGTLDAALIALLPAHLVWALHTAYDQSWLQAVWKSVALLLSYSLVLLVALVVVFLTSLALV
jgi:hypothetical protein